MRRSIVCFVLFCVVLAVCGFAGVFYSDFSSKSSAQPNNGLFIIIDAGHEALRNTICK